MSLIGQESALGRPRPNLVRRRDGRDLSLSAKHRTDIIAFERDHIRCRESALGRDDSAFNTNQSIPPLPIDAAISDRFKIGPTHRLLERGGLQRSPVDHRFSLGVVRDAESKRLLRRHLRREGTRAASMSLPGDPFGLDSVMHCPTFPIGAELFLTLVLLGEAALMGCDLRRRRAAESLTLKPLLDILPSLGKGHDLLAAVACQLPASIAARDVDPITKLLHFTREFGAVDRGGKRLRPVDLDWVEAPPLSVRADGHVGDDDVGVKMGVRACAVLRWARRDVIKVGGDDVCAGNPFLAAVLPRLCEKLDLRECFLHRVPMGLRQSLVSRRPTPEC